MTIREPEPPLGTPPSANGRIDAPAALALRGRALTDLGNAERFLTRHGADVRYVDDWARWICWDGGRWAIDDSRAVERLAKESILALLAEAAIDGDDQTRKALVKHVQKSESAAALRALLEQARSEPGVPVRPDDLDRDPMLLNVENGTLDLTTGRLRPHRRGDLLTRMAPVAFDQAAEAPTWDAFLERCIADPALIEFLQRFVGYVLTGKTTEQVLLILHGQGANGKTTFVETIRALLGVDYAKTTPAETFLDRRETSIPNDVARLRGARLVIASELGEGRRLNEALVKRMTGGDALAARHMRGEWFEFDPAFKPVLATNHRPDIRGTDEAIWRRIRLVPFAVTIPGPERDPDLPAKLRQELPGILAWAVRGCLAWQQHGDLGYPAAVAAATAEYRQESDLLGAFLADRCVQTPNARATAADLYTAYTDWCAENHERAATKRTLAVQLAGRGFTKGRSNAVRWWQGVGLLSDRTLDDELAEASPTAVTQRDASDANPAHEPALGGLKP